MTRSPIWVPWLLMLVGALCIAFSKRLGRDAVKGRIGTRFMPPEVAFVPARRKLEEDWYRWVFSGAGVLFIVASLWILARAYTESN